MKRATPYLYFPGQTEAAFGFYRGVFAGEYTGVLRFRDMDMPDGPEADLIAHISLPIADDSVLMGSDVGGAQLAGFRMGTNVQIHLAASDADEARRVFAALAEGGTVTMPLERVAWSELRAPASASCSGA